MSVVLALAGAGICPTASRAQPATPAATRAAVAPVYPAQMPTAQGRNELRPLAAADPGELKPAIDGPTAPLPWEIKSILPGEGTAAANLRGDGESRIPDAGFCRANPPWTGRHVLGGVTVSELTLNGDLHLAPRAQQKIASSIKQQTYFGDPDGVATGILERLRTVWQDHGFFKARVDGDSKVLVDHPLDLRIGLVVHVDEGPQYRLRQITFRGNRTILSAQALRKLFPLKDGQLLNRSVIAKGLDNLRRAYRSSGFINFTSIPNTEIDDQHRTVSLAIDMDEGKQFLVSGIRIIGLSEPAAEKALKDLALKPGAIYDESLADLFLAIDGALLPNGASPDSRIHMALNERAEPWTLPSISGHAPSLAPPLIFDFWSETSEEK